MRVIVGGKDAKNGRTKEMPVLWREAMLKINYGFDEKVISTFVYCEECGAATRSCALESTARGKWNRRVEK